VKRVAAVAGARSSRRSPATQPVLIVYHALAGRFTAVEGLPGRPVMRAIDCPLGQWAIRVAVEGEQLITLDAQTRMIAVIDLAALAHDRCAVTRTPLASGQLPHRGRLIDDRLYVVYFGDNIVEEYRWPERTLIRTFRFASADNLDLADVARIDGRLVVAATGYHCFERVCPNGRFGTARLYFAANRWPFPSVPAANVNASLIYVHPSPPSRWLLESGDLAGGWSSLQRIDRVRGGLGTRLGPALKLPRAAGIATAFPLGRLFVIMQMLGEHLFLVDAATGQLKRIARFDGARFVDMPLDTAELPERADSAFQDMVPEPGAPLRFYLVDRRGERLVHVEAAGDELALNVLNVIPLRRETFQSSPNWAVWCGG
jgi:hypothetical protein